jgi:hypothetical protein
MAHVRKPDFVFQRNGRVHLIRRGGGGGQFSRLLAAGGCASAVVMLDTPCSEVVWRVLATHSIRQFSLHSPIRASPFAITFQLDCIQCSLKHFDCNTKFAMTLLVLDSALHKSGQMRVKANFDRIHTLSHFPVAVLPTSLALMFIYCRYRFLTNTNKWTQQTKEYLITHLDILCYKNYK